MKVLPKGANAIQIELDDYTKFDLHSIELSGVNYLVISVIDHKDEIKVYSLDGKAPRFEYKFSNNTLRLSLQARQTNETV